MSDNMGQGGTTEVVEKGGRGGARINAGRKPRGTFAPVRGDLLYAKRLLSDLMRDESQPTLLRARCALAIAKYGTSKNHEPRPIDAAPGPVAVPDPAGVDRAGSHETGVTNALGSPDRPISPA